jgi:hypothetical protein
VSIDENSLLLDRIYEAATVPDKWPMVLDSLAEMTGGVGTFLITTDPKNFRWTSSESVRQLGLDFLEGRWHERNGSEDIVCRFGTYSPNMAHRHLRDHSQYAAIDKGSAVCF